MKNKEKTEKKMKEKVAVAGKICSDVDCPIHGHLKVRGKTFQGTVIGKHPKRITIEFQRSTYVRKYERFASYKTKIHARLPECMEEKINIGDYIKIQECRPLSKIIHFVVLGKTKKTGGEE
jgi:small subunit ribosomal protein S17